MWEISFILFIIWYILRPFWQGQESKYFVLTDIINEKKEVKNSTKASRNLSEIWKWLEGLDVRGIGLTYSMEFTEEVFGVELIEELFLLRLIF